MLEAARQPADVGIETTAPQRDGPLVRGDGGVHDVRVGGDHDVGVLDIPVEVRQVLLSEGHPPEAAAVARALRQDLAPHPGGHLMLLVRLAAVEEEDDLVPVKLSVVRALCVEQAHDHPRQGVIIVILELGLCERVEQDVDAVVVAFSVLEVQPRLDLLSPAQQPQVLHPPPRLEIDVLYVRPRVRDEVGRSPVKEEGVRDKVPERLPAVDLDRDLALRRDHDTRHLCLLQRPVDGRGAARQLPLGDEAQGYHQIKSLARFPGQLQVISQHLIVILITGVRARHRGDEHLAGHLFKTIDRGPGQEALLCIFGVLRARPRLPDALLVGVGDHLDILDLRMHGQHVEDGAADELRAVVHLLGQDQNALHIRQQRRQGSLNLLQLPEIRQLSHG